jgi:hypothetical protein
MYLIQEPQVMTSIFNFKTCDQTYLMTEVTFHTRNHLIRNTALFGTPTFNYYITDNYTAASLNMQIATLRFNTKLHTFN